MQMAMLYVCDMKLETLMEKLEVAAEKAICI